MEPQKESHAKQYLVQRHTEIGKQEGAWISLRLFKTQTDAESFSATLKKRRQSSHHRNDLRTL